MLPNSLAFCADGGKQCIYKQNSCVGLRGLIPFGLAFQVKAGVSAARETRQQGQQSKDGSGLGPWDLVE